MRKRKYKVNNIILCAYETVRLIIIIVHNLLLDIKVSRSQPALC